MIMLDFRNKYARLYLQKKRQRYKSAVFLILIITFLLDNSIINAIQLSIITVVFCHREPLFFMPKNLLLFTVDL